MVRAEVERALQAAELDAVATAAPTPDSVEFMKACQLTNRPVAIVSNNSQPAITAYLDQMGLAGLVAHIEGRDPRNPALMKPHPATLERAVAALHGRAQTAVLVGDSITDLEAAHRAGIRSLGYANHPDKVLTLTGAGADAVATSMSLLATSITALVAPSDQ